MQQTCKSDCFIHGLEILKSVPDKPAKFYTHINIGSFCFDNRDLTRFMAGDISRWLDYRTRTEGTNSDAWQEGSEEKKVFRANNDLAEMKNVRAAERQGWYSK